MRTATLSLLFAFAAAGCDSGGSNPTACENTSREIEIEEIEIGNCCATVDPGDDVLLNYTGRLESGAEFDSGEGVVFDLSRSISGFNEGVSGMRQSGTRRITIPPYRGYGTTPRTRVIDGEEVETIPACSVLIFDVTVLDILS